mmetsp:Transcript_15185/g.23123  ORF Transcript_15185/g.23123 Transcript_15185/m.23123 type:complete len:233 (+) Transcript_15185:104-802(+)
MLMSEQPSNDDLTDKFQSLNVQQTNLQLICDAGYGFPIEARPRREKLLAVAKQLHNFVAWQVESSSHNKHDLAEILIVGFNNQADQVALKGRLEELCKGELPLNLTFSSQPLESFAKTAVYLSPDAEAVLDATVKPPAQVVVGLLIDRRVQPNRSYKRATSKLNFQNCARLGLEKVLADIDASEPLNVDTVLIAMQQWWWNPKNFGDSVEVALKDHALRHPNRPLHKANTSS